MPLVSDSSGYRNFLGRLRVWLVAWRAWLIGAAVTIAPVGAWFIHDYPNIRAHVPMIWRDVRDVIWQQPTLPPKEATAPPQVAPPAESKQPDPKAEPKKITTGSLPAPLPPLPCVKDVAGIEAMLQRVGNDNFERNFDLFFTRRNACIVSLEISASGDRLMKFETKSFWNPNSPTVYVQPASKSELSKYTKGTKLKIEGRWHRYVRKADGPDEIYINEGKVTKAD